MECELIRSNRNLSYAANLGTRRVPPLPAARFPDAGAAVQTLTSSTRPAGSVDILLVNPPAPDGGIWIRSQHRVGRRSRENMIWPQVSLAQMAALLVPDYTVEIVDCIATRMGWPEFEKLLEQKRPKYYLTQVTAPTLRNDMYGVFLAKALGASTIAFGTHVTPMTLETMRPFPALDFVLRGEPEMTLRELLDTLEGKTPSDPRVAKMLAETRLDRRAGPDVRTSPLASHRWPGLARRAARSSSTPTGPSSPDLDDLPIPLHELLPLDKQRMPMIKGPFTFIVTSRGCPAGCKFCIKHVSYQTSVRVRSPQMILEELQRLADLGIHNIHMYADLFTVNREQVVGPVQADHRVGPEGELDLQQPGGLRGRGDAAADGPGRLLVHLLGHRERQRADPQADAQGLPQGAGRPGAELGARPRASTTGATSSSACPARPRRRSRRPSPTPSSCRSTSPSSTSPRPTPARPSSTRWWRTAGSAPAPSGKRWTWTSPPCWTTPACPPSGWNTGRSAPPASGRCVPARC